MLQNESVVLDKEIFLHNHNSSSIPFLRDISQSDGSQVLSLIYTQYLCLPRFVILWRFIVIEIVWHCYENVYTILIRDAFIIIYN